MEDMENMEEFELLLCEDACFLAILEERERSARCPKRVLRTRVDGFDLHDDHFRRLFRITKEMARNLIEELRPFMKAQNMKSALSVETRVFTALRFFAAGSYQLGVGQDFSLAISQKSVSRSLHQVAEIMSTNMLNKWIKFPFSVHEVACVKQGFYEKYRLPGVVGAIDCTHVAIVAPPQDDDTYPEHIYVNRKGYHSINVQLICDANMRILNVNARFPGSVHDSHIWKNSCVRQALESSYGANRQARSWLIGDQGYPLEPWLMTPIHDPQSPEEHMYNKAHSRARSIIEQCNGLLKNRWRCLLKHRVLHYKPHFASHIINSCVVLHNMCLQYNIPLLLEESENLMTETNHDVLQQEGTSAGATNLLSEARILRNQLVQHCARGMDYDTSLLHEKCAVRV